MSVIVPAYRQEKTIVKDLQRIESVLKQIRLLYEIICVVDGNVDQTYAKAKKLASKTIKVVGYLTNRGKGHAVRYGMKSAKGDYVAFIDAGMELDPNGLSMILEHLEWYKADIVVGSKRHPASKVHYPLIRRITSWVYQMLVRVLFGISVTDTQVGLKIFRKEVLQKTLPRLLVKQYAFDVEMLAVAHHLGFKKIFEAPVEIKYNFKDLTHASTLRSIYYMLWDTLAVFYRLRILRYYDDSNRKHWRPNMYLEW